MQELQKFFLLYPQAKPVVILAVCYLLTAGGIACFSGLRIHANIWCFLIMTPLMLYPTGQLVGYLIQTILLTDFSSKMLKLIWYGPCFTVLFCLEQLVFGLITRLLFPRQWTLYLREKS